MQHVGLIGFPVAHSLSPRMQQAAFDACGIDARYVLWETALADLPTRIASLRAPDVLGANVTIPHKEVVIHWIDEWDLLPSWPIAINTIVNRNGRLIGYNTDGDGLIQALATNRDHPFHCKGQTAIILGTGGAALGAGAALLTNGVAELILLGRNEAHLRSLLRQLEAVRSSLAPSLSTTLRTLGEGDLRSLIKEHLEALPEPAPLGPGEVRLPTSTTITRLKNHLWRSLGVPSLYAAILGSEAANQFLKRADLVVNATSVGLHEDDKQVLINVDLLPPDTLVMDMIYNPPTTPLLRAAQARGCATLNGLTMLLYQGALAFELWTGQPAPVEVMWRALGLS